MLANPLRTTRETMIESMVGWYFRWGIESFRWFSQVREAVFSRASTVGR